MILKHAVCFLSLSLAVRSAPPESFWRALHLVESGGAEGSLRRGGQRGPLQISKAYWQDSGAKGSWSDVDKLKSARTVAEAYMKRWARKAWDDGDVVTLARIHHGGPRGHKKPHTLAYARRVIALMNK